MNDTSSINHLPLEQLHVDAGARFAEFAGWNMPLSYSAGVMQEHLHTRQKAGLFDITHMRLFEVSGTEAAQFLSRCCPIEADQLQTGSAKYTFLLNTQAGIIDDLITTRLDSSRFLVVANAGRATEDEAQLRSIGSSFDCRIELLERVFLALQGPMACKLLEALDLPAGGLNFMNATEPRPGWLISRSGYTGEDGFEIALPVSEAEDFANKLLSNDAVMWIGLAARDSLRLEAGLCLYGQDLDEQTDPRSAALMWAIPKSLRQSGQFIGADALRALISGDLKMKRVGLKPEGRQPVRAGTDLFDKEGRKVGHVTSGGFGPTVGHPVAMAYVETGYAAMGAELIANVRGKDIPAQVHALPFAPHTYKKG